MTKVIAKHLVVRTVEGKKQERLIHVNALIRLGGLRFAPGPGGPAGREMRSGVTKLHFLSRDVHHSILACCFE